MQIEWTAFTWEAFATLVVGLAGVIAAFIVGRRQVALMHRQTELHALAVREALFDRRFATYQVVQRMVLDLLTENYLTAQQDLDLRDAIQRSHFLFSREVRDALARLYDLATRFQTASGVIQEQKAIRSSLRDLNRDLPTIFERDMNVH